MGRGQYRFEMVSPLSRRQFIAATAGLVSFGAGLHLPARALTINPRSTWGSDLPPKGPLSSEDVRFLIVHHSASHNGHTSADTPAILRGWFNFHTGPDRGWPDIAYNFIIDSEGVIWEGRQGSLAGAVAGSATGGNQGFTQLVCVIGDTNLAPATGAATTSLVHLLAWLADRYGVSTGAGSQVTFSSRGSNRWPSGTEVTTPTIAGHRDMSLTSCPGDSLYGYVAGSLMADVEAARGGSSPPPPPSTTSTTTTSSTSTTATTSTTTTVPPTTTVPSTTTTTTIPPTTTVPSTTTTAAASTSSSSALVSPAPPSPASPTAAFVEASPTSGVAAPTGLVVTAGSMLLAGIGLLAWRVKRMGS